MTVECQGRELAELVEGQWQRADLDGELRHLPDVDRVQVELLAARRVTARQVLWQRPRSDEHGRGRTVRLGLLDTGDVDALTLRGLEPSALHWAGRMTAIGPATARSVVEVLPSTHDTAPGTMPPAGLLSWPVDQDPPGDVLERGFMRWATALEQAHALRCPAAPHHLVVAVECHVAGRAPSFCAEVRQPRSAPTPGANATVRMSWASGRALWANLASQLTLADALLSKLCAVDGDVEAFLRLVNPHREPC